MMKRMLTFVFLAVAVLSATAQKRDKNLTVEVSTVTSDKLEGQSLTIVQEDYSITYQGVKLAANGSVALKVYAGRHSLTINRPGYELYTDTFVIANDTTISVVLSEKVKQPYALETSVVHDVLTGKNDVTLSWNQEPAAFEDDFESYPAWSIQFGEWTGIDVDNQAAAFLGESGTEYLNRGALQYAQIFNPMTVEPSWWYDYPVLRPYSGLQYVGFTRTQTGTANDDWLVSPVITVGVDNWLSILAKAADIYYERFQVYVTEVVDNPRTTDFVMVNDGNYETADVTGWKDYNYDLSAYAGKQIRFAIRYIGNANSFGAFVLMVDDVYVGQMAFTEESKPNRIQGKAYRSRAVRTQQRRSKDNPNETFEIYLNGEMVDETDSNEFLFKALDGGDYRLGVKAKYLAAESETTETQLTIPTDGYRQLRVSVTTDNGETPDGIFVELTDESTKRAYAKDVVDGVALFPSVPDGYYRAEIINQAFDTLSVAVTVDGSDVSLAMILKETRVTPFNITADQNGADVLLKWNQHLLYQESFESYDDFAQDHFGDWLSLDLDGKNVYPIGLGSLTNIVTFPGASTPSSPMPIAPMVFNPWNTTPAMLPTDEAVRAPHGDKTVVFFSPQQSGANKWLISPRLKIRDGYVWKLLAKAYTSAYKEAMEFCVSTDPDQSDVSAFQVISQTDALIAEQWAQYSIPLADYAGKEVYLGIHYISYDAFFAQVDQFTVGVANDDGSDVFVGNVLKYVVTLDGEPAGESATPVFTLHDVAPGTHQVTVKAVYASGETDAASYSFEVVPTAIDGVPVSEGSTAPTEYFTLSGQRVSAPTRGVFIAKDGSRIVKLQR